MRRLTLFLLALVLAFGLSGLHAQAARAGDDNAAVAINTKDGKSIFKLAFDIRRVAGEVVDSQNAAVAFASCENCRTVAIAIQIVLVTGSPSVVTPQNVAIAINENCTLCETFASAYQFVLGTGGPVRFTPDGRHELGAIRDDLKDLKRSDLSPEALQAEVDAIVERIRTVLDTQLVPVGPGDAGDTEEGATETTEQDLPPPTTETTPTTATETETVPTDATPTETTPTDTSAAEPTP